MQREIERKKLFESLGTQQDDLIANMESPLPSPVQDDQEEPQHSDNNSFPEPSPDARDEVESHSNAHVQRSEEPNSAANHTQVEEGIDEEPSIVCSESETKEVQIISPEEDNSVLEMNSNDFQEKQRVNVVQVFDDEDDELVDDDDVFDWELDEDDDCDDELDDDKSEGKSASVHRRINSSFLPVNR